MGDRQMASNNPPVAQKYCDVCWYDKGDFSEKPVRYCSMCAAWLCESCRTDYFARLRASMKRAFHRNVGTEKNQGESGCSPKKS